MVLARRDGVREARVRVLVKTTGHNTLRMPVAPGIANLATVAALISGALKRSVENRAARNKFLGGNNGVYTTARGNANTIGDR